MSKRMVGWTAQRMLEEDDGMAWLRITPPDGYEFEMALSEFEYVMDMVRGESYYRSKHNGQEYIEVYSS